MGKLIMHIAEAAGGVERYLELFVSHFDKSYKHVLLLSQNFCIEKFKNLENVDAIEVIKMCHNISAKDFKTIKQIKKLEKKYKPDLVYCHSTKAGFLGRIRKIESMPIIYNAHGWAFNMKTSSLKKFIYRIMERLLAKKTDKIVCISKYEYNAALLNKICKESKLCLIYNGIDYLNVEKTVPINRLELGLSNDDIIIGQVGRLCEQKGTDVFVRFAKRASELNDNYRFVLVGDGPLRQKVEMEIKDFGLEDKFVITGWVDNPLQYAAMFDVACLFSRWEGFGYVIEEYKALNKKIIASNVDAIPELLDDCVTLKDILNSNVELNDLFSTYSKKFKIKECVDFHKILFKSFER